MILKLIAPNSHTIVLLIDYPDRQGGEIEQIGKMRHRYLKR